MGIPLTEQEIASKQKLLHAMGQKRAGNFIFYRALIVFPLLAIAIFNDKNIVLLTKSLICVVGGGLLVGLFIVNNKVREIQMRHLQEEIVQKQQIPVPRWSIASTRCRAAISIPLIIFLLIIGPLLEPKHPRPMAPSVNAGSSAR